MLFTPIDALTGERLNMEVEEKDIPRGKIVPFTVKEVGTGKVFLCMTKECGLEGCICDAWLVEELNVK